MTPPRIVIAGLLALVAAGSPEEFASTDLATAVSGRRLSEAVRVFGSLAHPTAEDHYLVGYALMELHEPQEAGVALRAAKAAGFHDWKGWPGVDVLLDRVRTSRDLSPPPSVSSSPPPDPAIAVFTGPPTQWSAPVLEAVPEFAAVGRRIFGKDVPSVKLYLFADRPTYDLFFGALFGVSVPTAWQDGTGTTNVVTFCERDRQGKMTRAAGAPETISCVLHEFGHAWFGTYLMDRHDKEWLGPSMRRPWLDEGLADFVASLREPAFLERRAGWLREKVRKGVAALSFDEIAEYKSFYEKGDVEVHYWLSALFVADLLGPRDQASGWMRKILDVAGRSGDVEDAVKTATGKDLRTAFERTVRRFWS